MMRLKLWQIDAFSSSVFAGNPAAVVPLEAWLPAETMQAIAAENNLSETAFFVRREAGRYDLRWFTPTAEVELCGHATLASAFVVFTVLEPEAQQVRFATRGGDLTVDRGTDGLNRMTLPADQVTAADNPETAQRLGAALGVAPPAALYRGRYLMAVWNNDVVLAAMVPGPNLPAALQAAGAWGVIVTAPGTPPYDFVSRFFAPEKGVAEDPVTGSAHCALAPFWAARMGKKDLRARQMSRRGGNILCTDNVTHVTLAGRCALYLTGEIDVPIRADQKSGV